jgi:hypothetical protein
LTISVDESEKLRGKNRFTQHNEFERLDERVATHGIGKIEIGASGECRDHVEKGKWVPQDRDASGGVLFLEQLDLCNGRSRVIADVDDEQEGLMLRGLYDVLHSRSGADDTEIRRAENSGETLAQKRAFSNQNGREGPTTHGRAPALSA